MPDPKAEFVAALREIGRRAMSAAIASTLKGVGEVGAHLTDALQKSAQAAEKMSRGEPYENPFIEHEEGREDE